MMTRWISLFFALSVFVLVVDLVRREKLRFNYALGWLITSLLAMIFAVFPHLLFQLAQMCGFELPSNFIFFCIMSALVLMSLLMTIFLCRQNRRNDIMAQKIGMLESQIKQLKSK